MKPYQHLATFAKQLGWQFWKHGSGDHEKWRHPATGRITTIPRSGKRSSRSIANIKMHLRHGADKGRIENG